MGTWQTNRLPSVLKKTLGKKGYGKQHFWQVLHLINKKYLTDKKTLLSVL